MKELPEVKKPDKTEVLSFITNNIVIGKFPKNEEIVYDYILNVSDSFYLGNNDNIIKKGVSCFYFPMGDYDQRQSLSSIYGALQVLMSIYEFKRDSKVYIHCQEGLNRSPFILDAFYYAMIGEHRPGDNRLLRSIERGNFYSKLKTEDFLKCCRFTFTNPESFMGGMFDWVNDYSQILVI